MSNIILILCAGCAPGRVEVHTGKAQLCMSCGKTCYTFLPQRHPPVPATPDPRDALMERMADLLEGEPNLFGWRADRNAFLRSPEYRAWRREHDRTEGRG